MFTRPRRLSDDQIDARLLKRQIKRIGEYLGGQCDLTFQCLRNECGYIWTTKAVNVISNGHGCIKCANTDRFEKARYSLDEIHPFLESRSIALLGNYKNVNDFTQFKCLKAGCGFIWDTKFSHIYHAGSGCPKCSGNAPLTNEDIDNRLKDRNIKRLDNYIRSDIEIDFQCMNDDCGYIWNAKPSNIYNNDTGCPRCAGSIVTNEDIDKLLIGRNIRRLGNYINHYSPIEFQCLNIGCNFIWENTNYNITTGLQGCPRCNFNKKNENIIYEWLIKKEITFKYNYFIWDIDSSFDKRYRVDFYIPDVNTIIEYNGQQHYEPVCFGNMSPEEAQKRFIVQQMRDQCVRDFCIRSNIKLIEIDGREYYHKKLLKFLDDLIIVP